MRFGGSPRFGSAPYDGGPRGLPSLKEAFAVLLSGVLAGLSQPLVLDSASGRPLDESGLTGALMLLALVPALVVARAGATKRAYLLGAATLWVYFLVVAHWLVVPFSTYGGAPFWLAVPAVVLMTGAVACFVALPFAITRAAERRLGWPAWLTFPAALAGVELIRNHAPFGGMPWGTLGASLATVDVLRQGASLFGVYGLAFVVGLTNAVVSDVLVARRSRRRAPVLGLVIGSFVVVGLLAYGVTRLDDELGEGRLRVGLLQPSIPQDVINEGDTDVIVGHYQALQQEAIARGAEVVVWPEAALRPRVPADAATLEGAGVVGEGQREPPAAIVGALSSLFAIDDASGRLEEVGRTSAFVTAKDLRVTGRYDKLRLVPFGEYMPWPLSLFTDRVLTGPKSLAPGDAPRALPLEPLDAEVGITICWDGLFPDVTRALVEDGAVQLYNLTNDAWYGRSSQPWQHLAAYALRATETGRPIVRAANSGISGWFDARGRFHDGTLPFERATVVTKVPTSTEMTVYVRFGEWVALPSLVFTALLAALLLFARLRERAR